MATKSRSIALKEIWRTGRVDQPELFSNSHGLHIYTSVGRTSDGIEEPASGVGTTEYEGLLKATMEALERSFFLEAGSIFRGIQYSSIRERVDYDWLRYRWFSKDQLKSFPETRNLQRLDDVLWVPASNWIEKTRSFVPKFCLSNDRFPFYVEHSSNGWAIGPTPKFAEERAILELLERDAFLYHWWTKTPPQRLDGDLINPRLRRRWKQRGFHSQILRFETPWKVHVVATVLRSSKPPHFLIGCGCSLSPKTALEKSLQEAGALESFKVTKRSQDLLPEPIHTDFNILSPIDHLLHYAAYDRRELVKFLYEGPRVDFNDLETFTLGELRSSLKKAGQKIYVTKLQHPTLNEIGVSIRKAFSPTLIGIDFRHRFRNIESPRLKRHKTINPNPHPFA